MENLQEIINAQQERIELERKANAIAYIDPLQVEVYNNLLAIGFIEERFRIDKNNCVVIHLRREVSVWLNVENCIFNGYFLEMSNLNLHRLEAEELETIVKNIKMMFNIVFKK